VPRTWLSKGEVQAAEPNLVGTWGAGLLTPSDRVGDSHQFCQALAKTIEAGGGQIHCNSAVVSLGADTNVAHIRLAHEDQARTGFDRLIVANGLDGARLARAQGDQPHIYGGKGYSLTLELSPDQVPLAPRHGLLDHETRVAVCTLGNRVRIAGTVEFGAKDLALDPTRLAPLYAWAQAHLPQFADAKVREWAGFRPMRAQVLDFIQPSKANPRIVYNLGYGHLGWTLAAAGAEKIVRHFE